MLRAAASDVAAKLRARVVPRALARGGAWAAPKRCGRRSRRARLPLRAPPRAVRRWRRQVAERARRRELRRSAQGCPAPPGARVGRDLRRVAGALRHRRATQTVGSPSSAAAMKMVFAITEPDAGSNSHDLRDHQATARRRRLPTAHGSREDLHSPGSTKAAQPTCFVVATHGDRRHRRIEARPRPARRSSSSTPTRVGSRLCTPIPVEVTIPEKQYTLFFDDVVVPADRLVGTEIATASVSCSTDSTPNAS